jgi:hypothetical protein
MDNFDLKKFLVENKLTNNSRLLEVEAAPAPTNAAPQSDPEADKDAQQGLNGALALLQQGVGTIKPSPKDGQLDESMTLGLIVGAPGIISLLGKGVNGISSLFQKDKKSGTVVGNALKKFGHSLEHKYVDVIGELVKAAFPKRFEGQNANDESSELYVIAHGIYASMLIAAAVSSGAEAMEAHNLISKSLEGGLSAFKSAEVVGLAQKIAAV